MLRHGIKNMSLKIKFFLILFLSLTLAAVSVYLVSLLPYREYDEQLYKKSMQLLTVFSQQIDGELEGVADQTLQIVGDNVIQTQLTIMNKNVIGSTAWIEAKSEVSKRVTNLSYLSMDFRALQIRSADGTQFSRAWQGAMFNSAQLEAYWELAHNAGGREVWLPSPMGEGVLLLLRDIREIEDLRLDSIGFITLTVNLNRIVARCNSAMNEMDMPLSVAIYLDGARVYASNSTVREISLNDDGYARIDVNGSKQLAVRNTTNDGRWTYITSVPYDSITSSVKEAAGTSLALSLIVMTLALLISFALVISIINHFERLKHKFEAFATGNYQFMSDSDPYRFRRDEIGTLHCQFDYMARENKRMLDDNFVKQQLLLEAQIRGLRAQIRPHFLFNTLASIACLAESCDDRRIASMTDSLAHMLRATLNDQRDIITVREDLQIAREYMNIQLIRYGDRLEAEYDVDEGLMDVQIPMMTIQPLVENSVHYAAEEMLERCRIVVSARAAGKHVEIYIEDNGPGMAEDTIEKLESGEIKPDGLGIGLCNINQRLKLAFTEECGLKISRFDGKTRVTILLPGKEGTSHD